MTSHAFAGVVGFMQPTTTTRQFHLETPANANAAAPGHRTLHNAYKAPVELTSVDIHKMRFADASIRPDIDLEEDGEPEYFGVF